MAAVLRSLSFSIPALLAILGAVIAGGRFVIAEITDAQGGLPWRWAAAQNPGLFLLAVVLAVSVVPEASRSGLPESESWEMKNAPDASPTAILVRLAEWTYLWIMLAVTVIVFLGSYRIPGVIGRVQETSRLLTSLGAALFLLKVGALAAAVRTLRTLSRRVLLHHATALWLRFAVPACVVGVVLAAVWATLVETLSSSALADFAGLVTTGSLVVGIAVMVISLKWPRTATNLGVNPWL
jgi:NADH:ubiquinone oxidoreductase subunit H